MTAAVLGAGVALVVTRDSGEAPESEQLAVGEVRPGRANVVESADGVVSVTIPADSIAEPGTLTIEPVTGRNARHGWSIDLADAELVGPATISFAGLDLQADEPPPLVTSSEQPGGKTKVVRNVNLDGDTVVVTTRHFSNWFVDPWSDLVGTVSNWLVDLMDETASISGDRAPRCDGEQQVRDEGYETSSDSGRRVYWCLGWENDGAVLKVVNARRYGVLSEHTPGLQITAREQGGLVDRFAELFTPGPRQPGNHTALLVKGNRVEFTLDPTDPLVGVRLSPDPGGYLLTALLFAVETLDMAFKTAGVTDTAAKIVDALTDASCLITLSDLATSDLATPQEAQEFFIDALDLAFSCAQVAGAQIDVGPVNMFLVEPVLWLYSGIRLVLAGSVALTDLFVDLLTPSDGYRVQVSHDVPARAPLDVSDYDAADFYAPGGFWCSMRYYQGTRATCQFNGAGSYTGVPAGEEERCAEQQIGLAGVEITDDPEWVCSGGILATPGIGAGSTRWFDETGFPPGPVGQYGFGDQEAAALPVGEALQYGGLVCRALEDGVTCENEVTGQGFTLTTSGVSLSPS